MNFSMNENEIHVTKGGHQIDEIEIGILRNDIKVMSEEILARGSLGRKPKKQMTDEMTDTLVKG